MGRTFNVWSALLTKIGIIGKQRGEIPRRSRNIRRLRLEQLEHRQMLAVITVNVAFDEDDGVGDGDISLRDAVLEASDGDLIDFDPNVANIETLNLSLGQIDVISKSIFIDASMLSNGITIHADTDSRVFDIIDSTFGEEPPLVTLIGLTLTGGDVSGHGGAIQSAGLLNIQDCVIEANQASGDGGGIYVRVSGSGSTPLTALNIEGSTIGGNTASQGGGVRVDFNSASDDKVTISNSAFENNTASASGGGGLFFTASTSEHNTVELSTTTITGSTAAGDGGAILLDSQSARIDLSITQRSRIGGATSLEINTAYAGGGIFARANHGSQVLIENTEILGNRSDTNGGGVLARLAQSGALVVESSVISGNSAEGSNDHQRGNGGGIYAVAYTDIYSYFPATPAVTISRSEIAENTANNRGGGIFTYNPNGTETVVRESTISGNSVPYSTTNGDRNGGGIYAYFLGGGEYTPRFTISGSTIDHNVADMMGGGIFACAKFGGLFVAMNSTFSGNQTLDTTNGMGGGVMIATFTNESIDAYLRNITVTENTSMNGGGVASKNLNGIRVRITNAIISANRDHNDGPSNLFSHVYIDPVTPSLSEFTNNLIGSGTTVRDLNGTIVESTVWDDDNIASDEPRLGPLKNNGGPTPTHALLGPDGTNDESPAIDAGSNDYLFDPITSEEFTFDQRGAPFTRKLDVPEVHDPGLFVDIGAHEVGLVKVVDVVLNGVMVDQSNAPWAAGPISYAELVPLGLQFAPIYRDGVNSIQIVFSEAVSTLADTAMKLYRDDYEHQRHANAPLLYDNTDGPSITYNDYTFDDTTNTWTFAEILPGDKYRIDILASDVLDMYGRALDGYWDNSNGTPPTFDDVSDDPAKEFPSGNGMGGSNFQFMFALLPGDYNQDGSVDGADFTTYNQDEFEADGNGDGIETTADQAIWSAHLNEILVLRRRTGDYDDIEHVGMGDYLLWRAHYGETGPDLAADGNVNGIVDGADFTLWRYWENTRGAWFVGPNGVGSLLPIVDFGNAPKVVNVTISGSNSTHAAYSFDAHDGSGEQLMTVPVGGANTVSIAFSEDVNVVAGNLRLVGLRTFIIPTVAEFSYDIGTMTATWRFDDLVPNDHYLISLSDAVTDIEGNRLDGEWVNPVSTTTTNSLVSEFPSGDGNAGGHFNFVMTLLAGDFNLNNIVNTGDETIYWTNYLYILSDAEFIDGDASGDGGVGDDDVALLYGTLLLDLNDVQLFGDLDGDFDVDDDDLAIFGSNLGMSSPTHEDGDFDGDGDVDAADLDLMFAQYGLQIAVVS